MSTNKPNELSQRETEVLKLLADGLSPKLIAGKLHLSFATVRAHLMSVYRKLGVNGQIEAAAYARSAELMELRGKIHTLELLLEIALTELPFTSWPLTLIAFKPADPHDREEIEWLIKAYMTENNDAENLLNQQLLQVREIKKRGYK